MSSGKASKSPEPGSARLELAELERLLADARREANWKRWGPYLSERQWGTVREDYSGDGAAWDYLPHSHARSRAYRWGEDGLLGVCDREGRLCFALALWNGVDPILKERLFGLTGPQGNHGEDVKESYFYLDSTPTHSYMRALYKYPQREFPYRELIRVNRERTRAEPECELADLGAFDDDRYFDVEVEYAKAAPDDLLIRLRLHNRAKAPATLDVLPTLWFRNTWSWGVRGEEHGPRPELHATSATSAEGMHHSLGAVRLDFGPAPDGQAPELIFTENETNQQRLFDVENATSSAKDAFHEFVVKGRREALAPEARGTKCAGHYRMRIPALTSVELRLRLQVEGARAGDLSAEFDSVFERRRAEAHAFHRARTPLELGPDEAEVLRQARAGLLWSKQFYHYVVPQWLSGDPDQPAPPSSRLSGRNSEWKHVYTRDVISMPDKWEYPWFAAWDLAFHMLPFAELDLHFAKAQLRLLLREWYMHPNGQIPAYEWAFGDVNPPVHAWACWRVYKKSGPRGSRDREFLASVFQKLLLNFTWWVNRKDAHGKHLFSGGFLGMDNISIFDRSQPLPTGGHLEQADGTAWMAFYCGTMLSMAIELAQEEPGYEEMASKFFEHYVAIADAMNSLGGGGLWSEDDGFYYDRIHLDGQSTVVRARSLVGLIPLLAVEVLDERKLERLPEFRKRLRWFLRYRDDLHETIGYLDRRVHDDRELRLLSIPSLERLRRILGRVFDESEFLSPFGIRSLSKVHGARPFEMEVAGVQYRVDYEPGESRSSLYGGNSNWRGPIWFPINFLIVEALERYHHFYGDAVTVEYPTGSGSRVTLQQAANDLATRLTRLFVRAGQGDRPCHGQDERFRSDPHWRDLVLFHEFFHAETGKGLGASHQTGWTALVASLLSNVGRAR